MQKHTKIYFKSLGHVPGDFIACEISGQPAIDIHHITGRGRGGADSGADRPQPNRRGGGHTFPGG